MEGKPCIRGMRITVGNIVGLLAAGHSTAEILDEFPELEEEDIRASLSYASWSVEEIDLPLCCFPYVLSPVKCNATAFR